MTSDHNNDLLQLPRHIAVVMDGNGRWANKRFLPRAAGHHSGVKATRALVENCVARHHIEALTVFAFSSENWKRPDKEVSTLVDLFVSTLRSEVSKLHEQNVKMRFIGELTRFSENLQDSMEEARVLTQHNAGLNFTIAVNYGGQWDITQAVNKLIDKMEPGKISPGCVTEQDLEKHLSLADLPQPDLFIRTGGESRISNFLIWQLAYTELYFSEILWPDFDEKELINAIDWYSSRQRRFGKTGEQIKRATGNNR